MISRRKMIKSLAGYTAGSLLLNNAFATAKKSPHAIGLQLYTLRNEMGKDAPGTLKKVSELGFKEVENFGYNGKFFGMDAKTYRDTLNGLGPFNTQRSLYVWQFWKQTNSGYHSHRMG